MKAIDSELIEKNKIKFLEALYEIAAEAKRDLLRTCPHARDIGERGKLSPSDNERAYSDLKADGLIRYIAAGPHCCLTKGGRDFIEDYRFKKTTKGKLRAITTKSKELANTAAPKVFGYLGGLVSGWISAAGAIYFHSNTDAIKHWLGIK